MGVSPQLSSRFSGTPYHLENETRRGPPLRLRIGADQPSTPDPADQQGVACSSPVATSQWARMGGLA